MWPRLRSPGPWRLTSSRRSWRNSAAKSSKETQCGEQTLGVRTSSNVLVTHIIRLCNRAEPTGRAYAEGVDRAGGEDNTRSTRILWVDCSHHEIFSSCGLCSGVFPPPAFLVYVCPNVCVCFVFASMHTDESNSNAATVV